MTNISLLAKSTSRVCDPLNFTRRIKQTGVFALAILLLGAASAQADLIHWSGAAGDHDWSTPANWDGGVVPGVADGVLFDNTDGQGDFITNSASFSTNNFVALNFTISNLVYSNWTYDAESPSYSSQHTEIKSGQTLTVTNGLIVGVSSAAGKGFAANPLTYATISGQGGTLAVTGGNVNVGYQSSESATVYVYALLDMYNLGNFSFNNTNGAFGVAAAQHRRSGGEISLAATNVITASNIWVGVGVTGVGAHAGLLHLGQSNVFNCFNFTVGRDNEGDLDFEPGLVNPTLRLRNRDGVSPVGNVYMGYTLSASSSWGHGTNDFTPGVIDASMTNLFVAYHNGDISGATQRTIDSLLIGSSSNNVIVAQNVTVGSDPGGPTTNKTSRAIGLIDMQGGTFTAGNMIVGSAANACTGNGTISLHGGTFTATNVALGNTFTNGTAYGILSLDGGIMRISGDVTVGANTNGTAGGEIDLTNATFGIGGQIGGTNGYLTLLTLSGGTLELGLDGSTNLAILTTNLDIETPTTIAITSAGLVTGQFPLIAYQSVSGASGVAGLSLSLPAGVAASLIDNAGSHSVDLLVTSVPTQTTTPVLSSVSLISANTFKLSGTGSANQPYSVYASPDITLPMNQWTLLGTTNADAGGVIQFIDQATNAQRFYRLGH